MYVSVACTEPGNSWKYFFLPGGFYPTCFIYGKYRNEEKIAQGPPRLYMKQQLLLSLMKLFGAGCTQETVYKRNVVFWWNFTAAEVFWLKKKRLFDGILLHSWA